MRIAAGALPRGLHILNLSKNNISTIEGLRDLTRLRVLDLSYNRILRIGHGMTSSLYKIQRVTLANDGMQIMIVVCTNLICFRFPIICEVRQENEKNTS